MRLQSQLNIAFTTLLLVVLTVTGYTLYSLVLNLLIQNEESQLEEKGELLVHVLTDESTNTQDVQKLAQFLDEQDLQMFLYDRDSRSVIYSSFSNQITKGFIKQNDFSNNRQGLWAYGKQKFVTSRILFYPESSGLELILLTPLKQLQAVQKNFIGRMMFVLVIGGVVATMLSYFLTNKMVTPLSRVKNQLKQIEKRLFTNLQPIQATGEIREVSESVYQMAHQLKLYIDSQQVFFQNASHELKTPLMTIQGYTEGIRDGIFSEEDQNRAYEVIVQEVKRLKDIINEMTILAKLDSEEAVYIKEDVVVEDVINQALDRLLFVQDQKDIHVHDETNYQIIIHVDREKLLQAMLNIMHNAIRHAKSQVEVRLAIVETSLRITISDDGEGIHEELRPHIFHRFVKGKDGETGLGLAISRAIVEKMNGRLFLVESNGSGASFCIELPMKEKSKIRKES